MKQRLRERQVPLQARVHCERSWRGVFERASSSKVPDTGTTTTGKLMVTIFDFMPRSEAMLANFFMLRRSTTLQSRVLLRW